MATKAEGNKRLLKLAGMLEKMDAKKYAGDVFQEKGKYNAVSLWAKATPERWGKSKQGWPTLDDIDTPFDSVMKEFGMTGQEVCDFYDAEENPEATAKSTAAWIRKFAAGRQKKAAKKKSVKK